MNGVTQSDDAKARPPESASRGEPASSAMTPQTLRAIVIPYLIWAAASGVVVLAHGVLNAPGARVWAFLLKEGTVIAFLVATAAAVVGVLRHATRVRTDR